MRQQSKKTRRDKLEQYPSTSRITKNKFVEVNEPIPIFP